MTETRLNYHQIPMIDERATISQQSCQTRSPTVPPHFKFSYLFDIRDEGSKNVKETHLGPPSYTLHLLEALIQGLSG